MTKRPTASFEPFDVVVVPFPFTDAVLSKRRPALVLSALDTFGRLIHHSVLAMITSAKNSPWPLDAIIAHPQEAGLSSPSVVRMKFFTLDHRLIIRKIGRLASGDQKRVKEAMKLLFHGLFDRG